MYYNDGLQQFGPPEQPQSDTSVIGRWIKIHPQFNGPNEVYVRDMVMDGENMVVITNDGQMDMGVFSNHYVKQSEEEYDVNGNKTGVSVPEDTYPSEPEYDKFVPKQQLDYDLLTSGLGDPSEGVDAKNYMPQETHTVPVQQVQPEQSTIKIETKPDSHSTISRVFSKLNTVPTINLSIEWQDFPKNEIEMLVKYFDVSIEDIAGYISSNYITKNEIRRVVEDKLEEMTSIK